jgi:hypothetical protein
MSCIASCRSYEQWLRAQNRGSGVRMARAGEEDTAHRMGELMPPGRAHVCMDTTRLPLIFKEIFAHSLSGGGGGGTAKI